MSIPTPYIHIRKGRLAIRVRLGKISHEKFLGISCSPAQFDSAKRLLKANHPNRLAGNAQIQRVYNEWCQALTKIHLAGLDFTKSNLVSHLQPQKRVELFSDYANKYLEQLSDRKRTAGTIKTYSTALKHFIGLIGNVSLSELSPGHITKLETALTKRNYERAYIAKILKRIKAITSQASRENLCRQDPFLGFVIRSQEKSPKPLTKREARLFVEAEIDQPHLEATRRKFVFQMATSLAFTDMVNLSWADIGNKYISKPRQKTGELQRIPIIPIAAAIIELQRQENVGKNLFKSISNQKYNENLKELAALIGVNRHVSSHVARHTFATLALEAGMNERAVIEIMGITPTMLKRYQHVADIYKAEEMSKLASLNVFG